MLSNERLDELEALVKKTYPSFNRKNWPQAHTMRGLLAVTHPLIVPFCSSFQSIPYCCGVHRIAVTNPNTGGPVPESSITGINEMGGIGQLANLSEIQKAVLALWFHYDRGDTALSGIIATTPSNGHNHVQTATEKVLMEIGFTPVFRGNNGNYGENGNFVTLWVFQTSAPTPIPGLTPPVVTPPPPPVPPTPAAPAAAVPLRRRRILPVDGKPAKKLLRPKGLVSPWPSARHAS